MSTPKSGSISRSQSQLSCQIQKRITCNRSAVCKTRLVMDLTSICTTMNHQRYRHQANNGLTRCVCVCVRACVRACETTNSYRNLVAHAADAECALLHCYTVAMTTMRSLRPYQMMLICETAVPMTGDNEMPPKNLLNRCV
jgi:hypothetical protein